MTIRNIGLAVLMALAAIPAIASPAPAGGKEWFIREGSEGGDGTQAKPFADPWMALEKAEAGDVIHVTGGKYYGKLNQALWKVPFDNIQLIGGYDKEFKTRDPWTNRTELKWDEGKNYPNEARLSGNGCSGCVIDGITIDEKDICRYNDDQKTSRKEKNVYNNAIDFNRPVTIRNCMIVNPDGDSIRVPAGSTIENNLVVNALIFGINVYTGAVTAEATVIRNNTLLFGWGFKEPGKGAYDGALIKVNSPVNITNNIIAHSDSNSIFSTFKMEKVAITKNVFFANLFSNLKTYVEGKDIPIDDKNMGDLEELGLKAFDGNEVMNPEMALDPAWLDLYSKRTAYVPGKVTMDDMNKMRQLMGLPIIARGGTPALGVAPAYDLEKAIALMTPKNAKCKAGARILKLESKITGGAAAAPAKAYAKSDFMAFINAPGTLNGKDVEFLVGLGEVANVGSAPDSYKRDQITAYKIWDKDGSGKWTTAFMMKGTNAERICAAGSMMYRGSGKPETLYVVKGIAYESTGYPKHSFFVESMEKYDPSSAPAAGRPKGRDWFISMGAAGGNGTKEKPFKDPWQALEKCEAGDSIHISEGEYYGKLKVGMWKIDTTYISLIGGYNKEFTERNPWTHPTLLFCPPEYKGTMRGGYMIEGEGDHTGAVVDGIIFDKLTNNKYFANGDIDRDRSDAREHIWLFYPNVTIRNCVFLNGNGGALRVCNGALIENNIFINHNNRTINMTNGHTTAPSVIRNNTLLFSWEVKFGEGNGRGGNLLRFETGSRSIVDNNIFEFADNDAIVLALDPAEIAFTNNVFSHNLFCHVQKSGFPNLVVDGGNFKQLGDIGWKKSEGNVILPEGSGCPVDQKFFDAYLGRTAMVPGKVTMDEWNQFREMLGQPVIATGGKGPTGYMPAYPWKSAVNLIPKNPKCKAGARQVPIEVKFEGIERKVETFEYADSNWDAAKDRSAWDGLKGKRVQLKVSIKNIDNTYQLDDIKKEQYLAFYVQSVEGIDGGGLPMKCYIKLGTAYERVVKNAKEASRGKPEETFIIKGIARELRNMVVEVVERAD